MQVNSATGYCAAVTPVQRGVSDREAKFAVKMNRLPEATAATTEDAVKSFLTPEERELAQRERPLGTGVAKSDTVMFDRSAATPIAHPAFEYAPVAVEASSAVGSVASAAEFRPGSAEAPGQTTPVSDAHHAVEVVLHTIDRVAEREQTSVKLELSVGDAELEVRVQRHADEIRTTFRTDSSELRDALSQEWHAITAASADRGVRLAPPVFSADDSTAPDSSSREGSAQQEQRSPRQDETAARPSAAHPRGTTTSASATTPDHAPVSRPLAPAGTAHRLNFFA